MKRLILAIVALVIIGFGYVFLTDKPVKEVEAELETNSLIGAYNPTDADEIAEMQLLAQADLSGTNIHPALQIKETDIVLGDPNAPVTLIEYASMTCPHCARFHLDILSKIEETYIANGQVKFVMRDLPWDNFALGMAAITRCAPKSFFHPLVKAFFREQESIFKSADPLAALQQIASTGGMKPEDVAACVRNEDLQKQILAGKDEALNVLNVKGTPAVFVNGEPLKHVRNLRQVQEAIELALKQATQQG